LLEKATDDPALGDGIATLLRAIEGVDRAAEAQKRLGPKIKEVFFQIISKMTPLETSPHSCPS